MEFQSNIFLEVGYSMRRTVAAAAAATAAVE